MGNVETYFMDRFILKDSEMFILLTEDEQKVEKIQSVKRREEAIKAHMGTLKELGEQLIIFYLFFYSDKSSVQLFCS